jgi:hypothetical protein
VSEVRKLGARFSKAAREHVENCLGAISGYAPTLGLLYGVDPNLAGGAGSWSAVALADETVADLTTTYGKFGARVCYELDGLPVVIAQIGHLKQLDSGVLELRDNRLWPEQSIA